MNERGSHTLIAGLGNVDLCDEGFGIYIIQALRQIELPEEVDLFTADNESDLIKAIAGRQKVILIDTLETNGRPGDFLKLLPEDFLSEHTHRWLRHADIRKTIALAYLMGSAPKVVKVFGVIPANTEQGQDLSDVVHRQIQNVIRAVLDDIKDNRS